MVHAPFVVRLSGAALALTLPVACGSSSGPGSAAVPTPPASPSASASPAAPPLPAGLTADRYYTYAHPRTPGVAVSSENVLFIDSHRVTLKEVVQGQGPIQHEQLDVAGNEMTFSQAVPDGHPCDTTDVGVYRFTVSGNVLRFQAVKDTCSQRKVILTGHDLTLSTP